MALVGNKTHLDQVVTTLARDLQAWELRVSNLKRGMNGWDATALESISYTAEDAGKVLDAVYAMTRIVEIMHGSPEATGSAFADGIYPLLGID